MTSGSLFEPLFFSFSFFYLLLFHLRYLLLFAITLAGA